MHESCLRSHCLSALLRARIAVRWRTCAAALAAAAVLSAHSPANACEALLSEPSPEEAAQSESPPEEAAPVTVIIVTVPTVLILTPAPIPRRFTVRAGTRPGFEAFPTGRLTPLFASSGRHGMPHRANKGQSLSGVPLRPPPATVRPPFHVVPVNPTKDAAVRRMKPPRDQRTRPSMMPPPMEHSRMPMGRR